MSKCFFCLHKIEPGFKDTANLERFLTPRKKIVPAEKSGLCAPHQRDLSREIKYARYLALLPYTHIHLGGSDEREE